MNKVILGVAILFVAATVSTSTQSSQRSVRLQADQGPAKAGHDESADAPSNYQPMVAKYCIGCHNTRNPLPAGAPLALDKANFADPGADAATWERVVKKLGVGAMPPQGSPTPGAAELGKFRSALVASLDTAAAKKNSPGKYVLHRLNRTEYANAVRDLLGVTVDVADLLPSDSGEFGFDNLGHVGLVSADDAIHDTVSSAPCTLSFRKISANGAI